MNKIYIKNQEDYNKLIQTHFLTNFDYILPHNYIETFKNNIEINNTKVIELKALEKEIDTLNNKKKYTARKKGRTYAVPKHLKDSERRFNIIYKEVDTNSSMQLQTSHNIEILKYYNEYLIPDTRLEDFPLIPVCGTINIIKVKSDIYVRIESTEPEYIQKGTITDDSVNENSYTSLYNNNPYKKYPENRIPTHYIHLSQEEYNHLEFKIADRFKRDIEDYTDTGKFEVFGLDMDKKSFKAFCKFLNIPSKQVEAYEKLLKIFEDAMSYIDTKASLLGHTKEENQKYRHMYYEKLIAQKALIEDIKYGLK